MESGRNDLETNAEVNGTTKPVAATYKSIPDDDTNWQAKKEDNHVDMGKPENEEIGDGAKEKMLSDEAKISPKKDASQVIFISENGDAKIDIAPKGPTLSGMGKEELMKYANDPFWVRLRWFLFIGFWFLWFAMLLGAVAIIVLAPKCTPPQPKTWWEKSPIVQLGPEELKDKDSTSLANLLDTLKNQHISVISLSEILKSSSDRHVTDFRDVNPSIGMKNIKSLIELAKQRGQKVVLEIDPNHSGIDHPWFQRSLNETEPEKDYYVWVTPKSGSQCTIEDPNNWRSVHGNSAWKWSPKRQQCYLHQFDENQPDLNFNNSLVIAEFTKIFTHWLDLGISGFRLGSTQYLLEDPRLTDEGRDLPAAEVDSYEYLNHVYTKNMPGNVDVLRIWRDHVKNKTNGDALFTLKDDIAWDTMAVFNEKNKIVDLPQSSQFLITANNQTTAQQLQTGFEYWRRHLNNTSNGTSTWPGWDLNGKDPHTTLRQRMSPSPDEADSIILMSLLIPGTPILKLNDTLSAKTAFAKLAEMRNEEIFLNGDYSSKIVNGSVFVYTRLKSGLPGYLVAYQGSYTQGDIDVSEIPQVPEEVNIVTYSPNYARNGTIETKLSSRKVPMAPKSTVVLSFVPSKDEK